MADPMNYRVVTDSPLTVTDAQGRKYRAVGQFREPKPGEFLYCFDHKRVEQRREHVVWSAGVHAWCSNAHVEFLLHRIIVEPVETVFDVTVTLSKDDLDKFRHDMHVPAHPLDQIIRAIREGKFTERSL